MESALTGFAIEILGGDAPKLRSVETLLTDLKHAGFPDVALLTDRGYESVQNLEKYILASRKKPAPHRERPSRTICMAAQAPVREKPLTRVLRKVIRA